MGTPVRKLLAENLKGLMQRTPQLSTQKLIEAKSGIAQTSVSNMLRPDNPRVKYAPRMDQVEKVAEAFGLSTWQLLLDRSTVGAELADVLMRPSVKDDDRRLEKWAAHVEPQPAPPPGPEVRSAIKKHARAVD